MNTRRYILQALAAAAIAPTAWAHETSPASWSKLSQSKKNLRIVSAALAEVGTKSKLSCKEWVRKIVRAATDSHVEINSNDTKNLQAWLPDESGHVTIAASSIEKSKAGHLVQMILKSGWEHTAIIVEISTIKKTVTFVDSNYDNTPADNSDAKVQLRTSTFDDFYAGLKKPTAFSVYQVS